MITVRRATAPDARDIAEAHVDSWRAAYPAVFPQEVLDALDVEERRELWRRAANDEAVALFVAEEDDRVVGFVSVGPCRELEDTGELYAIYARPEAWGSGAGTALIEAGVDWLSERWTEAVLWVAEANPRARRFYERHGWAPEATRIEEIRGTDVPEVRYRLSGLGQR